MNVTFLCPYCNMKNGVWVDTPQWAEKLIRCDIDSGGCDKAFVVEYRFTPQVKVLKIEQEVEPNA